MGTAIVAVVSLCFQTPSFKKVPKGKNKKISGFQDLVFLFFRGVVSPCRWLGAQGGDGFGLPFFW
jgi:hypothetical protein